MLLRDNFRHTLFSTCLVRPENKILLALSGGLDSMVLCHLLLDLEQPFGVAHVNYRLRGQASDEDELFVADLARRLGIPFYSMAYDTAQLADGSGESIQMIARKLRYTWLEELRAAHGYDLIATAHHANDNAETMILNLSKGCGIAGLHGISAKAGNIIRPLIGAKRTDLEVFARQEGIRWREDASNAKTQYQRNKIRLQVIPQLTEINPRFMDTMTENASRFRECESLYQFAIQTIREQVCAVDRQGNERIDLLALMKFPAQSSVLFELLKPFGFNNYQVAAILQHAHHSGRIYQSTSRQLIINRGTAILTDLSTVRHAIIHIDQQQQSLSLDGQPWLEITYPDRPAGIPTTSNIALLDFDKLSWPLRLRHWLAGDFFYPLGMGGKRKKLQDFFTNQRLSINEKQRVWILLTANDEICWVLNYRIDERFKITENTERFIQLNCY
jgi:tRNA(Ile)-lysidine synthase